MHLPRFAVILTLLISLSFALSAQRHPDEFLIGNRSVPQVMVVGTFHFAYPNLDAHTTAPEDQVDVTARKKQNELQELLDYLARFKPTKIVVESGPNTGYLMHRYKNWKAGLEPLRRNEREQIGLRLMHRLGLDTLYGCDAGNFLQQLDQHPATASLVPYFDSLFVDYDWRSNDPVDSLYDVFYDYETELEKTLPLLSLFHYMNSDPVIRRYHGAYLVGDFKQGETIGPDFLSLFWYNRNLRIFRNIQSLEIQPEDRILVLFGAGHTAILREQFMASPEFEWIPFADLGGWE